MNKEYLKIKKNVFDNMNASFSSILEGVKKVVLQIKSEYNNQKKIDPILAEKMQNYVVRTYDLKLKNFCKKNNFIREQYQNIVLRHERLRNWNKLYPFSTVQPKD